MLKDNPYSTTALRVSFLVRDPSGQYEAGDPVVWTNRLVLRTRLREEGGERQVELFVAPRGEIRYSLDGSEPRDGKPYDVPIAIGDNEVLLRAFATSDGLEVKEEFRFPARGKKGVHIDETRPARMVSRSGHKLDSRTSTFEGLKQAEDKAVGFENVLLTVGQGAQVASITIGEVQVDAAFLTRLLENVLDKFPPDTPGHDGLPQGALRVGARSQAVLRDARTRHRPGECGAVSEKGETIDFGAPKAFGAHVFRVEIPAARIGEVLIIEDYGYGGSEAGIPRDEERVVLARRVWSKIAGRCKAGVQRPAQSGQGPCRPVAWRDQPGRASAGTRALRAGVGRRSGPARKSCR